MESIAIALPQLSEELIQKLKDFITDDLGVLGENDLKLIKEADLLPILKPIQARKIIQYWKNEAQPEVFEDNIEKESTSCDDTLMALSSNSSACSSGSSSNRRIIPAEQSDWDFRFEIPWNSFPKSLLDACDHKKKPEKRHRLEMVRIVVDAIHKVCAYPKLKNIEKIAYRIISRYPNSFKDEIDGIVIGSGLESLTTQIMYRSDNIRRRIKKESPSPCTDADSDLLKDDDQSYLQAAYFQTSKDEQRIKELMKKAYSTIRLDIKKKLMIGEVKGKWPFLFDEKYFYNHLEMLLDDFEVEEKLAENVANGSLLVFKTLQQSSNISVAKMIGEIEQEVKQYQNERPKVIGIVKLLTCYFNEKADLFYRCFSGFDCIQQIVTREALPKHPLIIVKGESPVQASMFFIIIENEVVFKADSFLKALCYCFCCYYVFDMQYPKQLELTLEFIQRYFARINKQEKTAKRSRRSVPPKVVKLANEIMLRQGPTHLVDE